MAPVAGRGKATDTASVRWQGRKLTDLCRGAITGKGGMKGEVSPWWEFQGRRGEGDHKQRIPRLTLFANSLGKS